jgi:hypothetical protein
MKVKLYTTTERNERAHALLDSSKGEKVLVQKVVLSTLLMDHSIMLSKLEDAGLDVVLPALPRKKLPRRRL